MLNCFAIGDVLVVFVLFPFRCFPFLFWNSSLRIWHYNLLTSCRAYSCLDRGQEAGGLLNCIVLVGLDSMYRHARIMTVVIN